MSDDFQPTLLGTVFVNEENEEGMITDETEDRIFIESKAFTGWTSKEFFFSLVENDD